MECGNSKMNNENKIRNANNLDKLGIDIITKTESQTLKDKIEEREQRRGKLFHCKDCKKVIFDEIEDFIRQLKEDWKTRCKKMEIMSGEVAIFELESIIKNRSGFSSQANIGGKDE